MPVHRGNIGKVIQHAWNDAIGADITSNGQQETNRKRSRAWMHFLAERFGEHYEGVRHRLFWSGNDGNREEFKLNELLFDLAVCSVSTTASLQRRAQSLPFIARCHWQIESEFSRNNTRDIVVDMSKLVMGSAENNLFIASHRAAREEDILEQSSPTAACCSGRVYFCFVSHPDDWRTYRECAPALHEWVAGGWATIALPPAS